jgi:hypothetical protein
MCSASRCSNRPRSATTPAFAGACFCAAALRGRAVLTCANLPIPIRVAPSAFLLPAHIFSQPSLDARCAPACASQYLPAASTVVPRSVIPCRPSPAARPGLFNALYFRLAELSLFGNTWWNSIGHSAGRIPARQDP